MPKITDISQLDFNKQYTYADYLTWQFNERVELIKGWLHKMTPAPKRKHQRISAEVEFLLMGFIKKENLDCNVYYAPFDVRLINNKTKSGEIYSVVQPDICVVCDKSKLDEYGCLGAPDMIIEILSPSTSKKDYNEKFHLYEENGVKEYWIINPDAESVEVFVLENEKYFSRGVYSKLDGSTHVDVQIFDNLSMSLQEIFQE
jgi:Uma2 family endonuclease